MAIKGRGFVPCCEISLHDIVMNFLFWAQPLLIKVLHLRPMMGFCVGFEGCNVNARLWSDVFTPIVGELTRFIPRWNSRASLCHPKKGRIKLSIFLKDSGQR